jgi:hypothetical protein
MKSILGSDHVSITNHELQAIKVLAERKSYEGIILIIELISERHLINKELETITGKDTQKWQMTN